MTDRALTLSEAAGRLSVEYRTLWAAVHRREIPAFKVGRVWRIWPADLAALSRARILRVRPAPRTGGFHVHPQARRDLVDHIRHPNGRDRIRRSARTSDRVAAQELHDTLKSRLWRQAQLGERRARSWDEQAVGSFWSPSTRRGCIREYARDMSASGRSTSAASSSRRSPASAWPSSSRRTRNAPPPATAMSLPCAQYYAKPPASGSGRTGRRRCGSTMSRTTAYGGSHESVPMRCSVRCRRGYAPSRASRSGLG